MKKTLLICASALFVCSFSAKAQLGEVVTDSLGEKYAPNPATWTIEPNADFPLVINENFQDWTLNHDKPNTSNDATSKGRAAATSYATWNQTINLVGPLAGQTAAISLIKCAAAPQGLSQNKIEYTRGTFGGTSNTNYTAGQIADPEDGTPLSVGFLEVSRCNSNGTGSDLSVADATHGIVTLPAIKGALVVQYAYSSIGGSKRAIKLERSIDGGNTWEIIRNPWKNIVQFADRDSTKEDITYPSGNEDVATTYKPYKSAYFCSGAGVRLEDFIGDGEETVTLRFTINDCWKDVSYRDAALAGTPDHANGHAEVQDFRLHEIRLIATSDATLGTTGVNSAKTDAFVVLPLAEYIATSITADIQLYNLSGMLIREAKSVKRLDTNNLAQGAYIVKAVAEKGVVTKKFIVR
ncbi:MAG: T9SS type A sorting domain-containing protein [Paludibacter sp.]|nr:T9SS type A sorting domain-containing protein [Paludibacter sp.]